MTSSTLKIAWPTCVLRRNSTWRAIVCGWFCFASAVSKCVATTWRIHPVTYPPFGTTGRQLGDDYRRTRPVFTGTDAPVVVEFTRVRVRAELLHCCGLLPGRHNVQFPFDESKFLIVDYYMASVVIAQECWQTSTSEVLSPHYLPRREGASAASQQPCFRGTYIITPQPPFCYLGKPSALPHGGTSWPCLQLVFPFVFSLFLHTLHRVESWESSVTLSINHAYQVKLPRASDSRCRPLGIPLRAQR